MPHPSQPTATEPPPAKKPRGNPTLHLAPRCGARTRSGCPCRSPAIHGKLRCRMHGGRSPGPRTPEGRDRVRAAHTIHGYAGAEPRAENRYRITLLHRNRVTAAAVDYQDHLPPVFVARLCSHPPELLPPPKPTGGISAAADRIRRRAVAAALAPWKQAIAAARAAHLAARAAKRAAQPHAPVRARPPRDARAAQPHAPICRPATPAATTRANPPPQQAPAMASPPHASQNANPGRRPTPPGPAPQAPREISTAQPPAPDRAPAPNKTCAAQPHAPIPGRAEPAVPPGLPNRAARRRWKRLQRLKHTGSAARALPTARG